MSDLLTVTTGVGLDPRVSPGPYRTHRRIGSDDGGLGFLDCGHQLTPSRYEMYISTGRCPICQGLRVRNPEAEREAHEQFMSRQPLGLNFIRL